MSATRILVVEDEVILANDLKAQLEELGYVVLGVTDTGAEAVRLAGTLQPHVVLMDIRLRGEMDGITAAGLIRQQYSLPVVYLTAYSDEATLARAKITEPLGYIHKPCQVRDLRTAVEMALYKHQTEETLRQQATALREMDRHKNAFLAVLAHELRTPLASIHNAIYVLTKKGEDRALADQMRNVIDRQASQISRLVEDLLDVSRISQGKIELRKKRLDLAAVVRRAVEASRPLVEAAQHELTVVLAQEPIWVAGDLARLTQVLSNLLNNAAKYTPEGGRIGLTVEQEGEQAVIRVTDNGLGIPAEMLPRIFEMFTQADRHLHRAQGGLGIGLTLVKRLVEMHGGTIEALSAGPGQGSTFTVRLPLVPGSSQAREPERRIGEDRRETSGLPLERRAAHRIPLLEAINCRLRDEQDLLHGGILKDISTRGLGLIGSAPLVTGAWVPMEIPQHHSCRPHRKRVRVTHVQQLAEDCWQIGGEFIRPLSPEELSSILGPDR